MVTDTHLSRWVEQDRRLDHARGYLERFRDHIPVGGTVIDCGTSIGDHTITYAEMVGPTGRVFGFEANPDVAECCQLNMGGFEWVEILPVGLSDTFSSAGIEVNENVGASRLVPGDSIQLSKLDDYLPLINRCDFIKVDIEGYEVKMLRGAEKLIRKYRPVILMEVNDGALRLQGTNPDVVWRTLMQYGYTVRVAEGEINTPMYDILAKPKKR